jgi:hypothetical protein
MYISMRESAAAGFKKWSAARPNSSTGDVAGAGVAVAGAAGEDAVLLAVELQRGPWLVPGPGTL